MILSADGSRLISIDSLMTATLWDVAAAKELKSVPLPSDIHAASLSPVGQPGSCAAHHGTSRLPAVNRGLDIDRGQSPIAVQISGPAASDVNGRWPEQPSVDWY